MDEVDIVVAHRERDRLPARLHRLRQHGQRPV